MRALYDCSKWICSFNFFEWLIQAHANGATKIVFDIRGIRGDKWPTALSLRRFHSILEPGCALAGLPFETFGAATIEPTNARRMAEPGGRALVEFCKAGRTFTRLRSVRPPGLARYTVTRAEKTYASWHQLRKMAASPSPSPPSLDRLP